jgi:hypothetical protein
LQDPESYAPVAADTVEGEADEGDTVGDTAEGDTAEEDTAEGDDAAVAGMVAETGTATNANEEQKDSPGAVVLSAFPLTIDLPA